MPILKYRTRTLSALSALIPEITYVMCGARGETSNRLMRALPQMRFVGFEPDPEEYERLSATASRRFTYVQAAVGGKDEPRTLYVTRNPGCSSLLRPNHELYSRFKDCGPDLEVVAKHKIQTISLNSYSAKSGLNCIDFLDLDTQGSELEILRGAEPLLSDSTVAVKCEVEFLPLYQSQHLFADVDSYLRQRGFMLFDLSRSRYRRQHFPAHALTRGQLLWGDALYLRDYRALVEKAATLQLFKLCLLAAHLQFHDYALEVLAFLLNERSPDLTTEESAALVQAREQHLRDLRRSARWLRVLCALDSVGLRRPIKLVGRLSTQLGDRLRKDRSMMEYNWVD